MMTNFAHTPMMWKAYTGPVVLTGVMAVLFTVYMTVWGSTPARTASMLSSGAQPVCELSARPPLHAGCVNICDVSAGTPLSTTSHAGHADLYDLRVREVSK